MSVTNWVEPATKASFILAQAGIASDLLQKQDWTIIGLYATTMVAIGWFLYWYIPKKDADHEKQLDRAYERYENNLTQLRTDSKEQLALFRETMLKLLERIDERLDRMDQTFTESIHMEHSSRSKIPPSSDIHNLPSKRT